MQSAIRVRRRRRRKEPGGSASRALGFDLFLGTVEDWAGAGKAEKDTTVAALAGVVERGVDRSMCGGAGDLATGSAL